MDYTTRSVDEIKAEMAKTPQQGLAPLQAELEAAESAAAKGNTTKDKA